MHGNIGSEEHTRFVPSTRRTGKNHEVVRAPCYQRRIPPGRCVELPEKCAPGSHFPTRGKRYEKRRRTATMWRVQQCHFLHLCLRALPEGFANHQTTHAVANKIYRDVELAELRGKCSAESFNRDTSAVIVLPNRARTDFFGDAAAEAFPPPVRAPNPIDD